MQDRLESGQRLSPLALGPRVLGIPLVLELERIKSDSSYSVDVKSAVTDTLSRLRDN